MQLETTRLILRDHQFEDWVDIHDYAKDPEFSKYDVWGPNTEQDSKNFVLRMITEAQTNPRYKFDLAVVDKKSLTVIGGIGLRKEAEQSYIGNMGWAIHPLFQNKGLATEAAKACLNFGFNKLNLQIIYATCDALNPASYRVMEKIGMRKVGLHLKHKEFKGTWHDSLRYEIANKSI